MQNPKTIPCPDPRTLGRFLNEELSESEEAPIQEHLDACSVCQEALAHVAGDEHLWEGLETHLTHQPLAGGMDPTSEELEDLKALLNPTDDPTKLGRIGSYEVVGMIGRGTTGLVVKALEPRLERFVAIKLMSPSFLPNGTARSRYEREGRAIAAVSHEHVVPIYAVDEHRGLPFIVMKYIPGLSLQQRIDREGPLDTCEVTRIGLQVALGLSAAHGQGIIHRDVKPANVILESTVERAMVTDFGLARVADEASMTRSGTIAGTPQYMSPEQARGESIDARSDLFSLGSLMYAACTGRAPFRAETVFGVIHRVCETESRPIQELNPEIADWLVHFIEKLMAKGPEDRFHDAREVAEALSAELAHLQNPTVMPLPDRPWLPAPLVAPGKWDGSRRGLAIGALSLAAIGAAFGGIWFGLDMGTKSESDGALTASLGSLGGAPLSQDVPPAMALMDDYQGSAVPVMVGEGDLARKGYLTQRRLLLPAPLAESLVLRIPRGGIRVVPGEDEHIAWNFRQAVIASDQKEALQRGQALERNFTHEGSQYIFSASPVEGMEENLKFIGDVHHILEVPESYNVTLSTGDGDIVIGALGGEVQATATRGDIQFAHLLGSIDARVTEGVIDGREGCAGHAELLAIHGDIYLENAEGGARVRASGGNLMLGYNPSNVSAHAEGGDVAVDGVWGPLQVEVKNGDLRVRVDEDPTNGAYLSASDGNVHVELDPEVKATLVTRGFTRSTVPTELSRLAGQDLASAPSSPSLSASAPFNGGGFTLELIGTTGELGVEISGLQGTEEATPEDKPGLGGSGEQGLASNGSGSPAKTPKQGLGGSGEPGASTWKSLGGSGSEGLGGSGSGSPSRGSAKDRVVSGPPRPGAFAKVALENPTGSIDGYMIYLPQSFLSTDVEYPILVYNQGAYGVGGEIEDVIHWGLPRLLRDETDRSTERNRLLLDGFIVLCLHIREGNYHDQPEVVQDIIDRTVRAYRGDVNRVYVTGLSRGGHGAWGLASRLPNTFAAVAPMGGGAWAIANHEALRDQAVWLGHNGWDGNIPFDQAAEAAERLEALTGKTFLRTRASQLAGTDFLEQDLVFTSDPQGSHDAWTDVYSGVEFYRWLLTKSRATKTAAEDGVKGG